MTDKNREEREPRMATVAAAVTRNEKAELERFARAMDVPLSRLLRTAALRLVDDEKRYRRWS